MRRHRMIGWLAVGVALWSAGCAAPRVTRSIFQEGEAGKTETFVRLDSVDPKERFDHPAVIQPARLKDLLASVAVRKRTGLLSVIFSDKPFRAFSDEQLDLLSAQLSTALAKAAPEEMAMFYFNAPESNEQLRITSGGVYVRKETLVVVLANYRYTALWSDQAAGRPYVSTTAARENPLYAYPEGAYQLIVGAGQERLGGEEGWFNKVFGSADRRSGVVLALNATPPSAELESAAAPAPASSPEPAAAAAPAAPPAAAAPPVIAPAPSPLEDKLRQLKRLHDEGLISDADYDAKKQELLKSF